MPDKQKTQERKMILRESGGCIVPLQPDVQSGESKRSNLIPGTAARRWSADGFICAFQNESDARRFQDVLRKRLARFSLELAEEKSMSMPVN